MVDAEVALKDYVALVVAEFDEDDPLEYLARGLGIPEVLKSASN